MNDVQEDLFSYLEYMGYGLRLSISGLGGSLGMHEQWFLRWSRYTPSPQTGIVYMMFLAFLLPFSLENSLPFFTSLLAFLLRYH